VSAATVDALAGVPLFAGLERTELERLAERFRAHTFPAGTEVTIEGRRGARVLAFFVITEGSATVTKAGKPLATLGPGDHFGEVALFDDVPRMATVTADTDLACLALGSWEFRPFVEENPTVGWRMLETMSRRLDEAASSS
jgi:CRP/FNR family cyclic AMP-dependent transcriptional regulator